MDRTPFEEGVTAATDGSPSAANPYPDGSEEHKRWNEGYHSVADPSDETDLPTAPDQD